MLVMSIRIGPRKPVRVYLALHREALGLSQETVGGRLGVGKGTISRWENAKRIPTINVLAAYAEALNIPVQRLYSRPEELSLDALVEGSTTKIRALAYDLVKRLVAR